MPRVTSVTTCERGVETQWRQCGECAHPGFGLSRHIEWWRGGCKDRFSTAAVCGRVLFARGGETMRIRTDAPTCGRPVPEARVYPGAPAAPLYLQWAVSVSGEDVSVMWLTQCPHRVCALHRFQQRRARPSGLTMANGRAWFSPFMRRARPPRISSSTSVPVSRSAGSLRQSWLRSTSRTDVNEIHGRRTPSPPCQ